jgi:hypothetical protein
MKVFVSWSGDHSKLVATALREWLPMVFQSVDVWMSDDITAGARWGLAIGKALDECKFGIICLTAESLASHWISFEAGALSKAFTNSFVIPYLFGLRSADISPPLSQFQFVSADEEGTRKLVKSINTALGADKFGDRTLETLFAHCWPELERELDGIRNLAGNGAKTPVRTDRELLEEMLEILRQRGMESLNSILARYLTFPNIRTIEIAKKKVAGMETDRIALKFTVLKKQPLSAIPKDEQIPTSIFGMPTDVVESAGESTDRPSRERMSEGPNERRGKSANAATTSRPPRRSASPSRKRPTR